VLLAGDAAHQQMPVGGQAMNLGLQDAVNLGWKLAAEVRGRAPEGLLDSYHTERHEVGRRVLRNIEAQALLLLGGADVDPAREVLAELIGYPVVRDLLAGTISGLNVRYERGWHPLVGTRLPQVDLAGTSTTELLRTGRGFLLDGSADPGRGAWLRRVVPGLDVVATLGPIEGLDTVLVRPDGYVAWASAMGADPRPAIRRWFGA
jgi:hypothetical protein